jgi:hypothetical protein
MRLVVLDVEDGEDLQISRVDVLWILQRHDGRGVRAEAAGTAYGDRQDAQEHYPAQSLL